MKRTVLVLAVSLSILAAVMPTSAHSGAEPASGGKQLLWRAVSATTTVYLFGSVHLAKPDFYPLPKVVSSAFDECPVLALEADPAGKDDPALQAEMLALARYERGRTLRGSIDPALYTALSRELTSLGPGIEPFEGLRPWFIATSLELLVYGRLGYDPSQGLDSHFAAAAAGRKRIVELESFVAQLRMLGNLTPREEETMLRTTLDEMGEGESGARELMGAWRAGDEKALEAQVLKSLRKNPDAKSLFDKLLFSRNRVMADRVEGFLRGKEKVFVVVGAAHLVGAEGVVTLLQKRGVRVERL